VEEVTAEIDTSGLKPGTHQISVKAMELENIWGVESSISFKVMQSETAVTDPEGISYLTIALMGIFIILSWSVSKLLIKKQ
jgi:hypothetical protein